MTHVRIPALLVVLALGVLIGCASAPPPPPDLPEQRPQPPSLAQAKARADAWAREDAEAERRLAERAAARRPADETPPAQPEDVAGNDDVRDDATTLDPDQPMPDNSVTTHAVLTLGKEAGVMIDARSDIFSSGEAKVSASRGGVLPSRITLAAGRGSITFRAVRGRIGCQHRSNYGPDGGSCAGGNTTLRGAGVLSGIVHRQRTLFVTGVFVGPVAQTEVPKRLDFSNNGLGTGFEKFAPQLGQLFFIGDGLTGAGQGQPQRFVVPDGATHLYLGFSDGPAFQGTPGSYGDNTGSLALRLTQQP